MSLNPISVVLILSGVLALVISLFLLGNRKSVARLCGMMMSATGIWGITYGMQFTTTSFDQIMFWTYLEYVGIAVIPPLWLIFTLNFAGKEHFLTRNRILALFLVPIVTVVLVATNEYHHLHYRTLILNTSGPVPVVEFETGIWYWIFTSYFYAMLILGAYLMIAKYQKSDTVFRKQNSIILVGTFLPVIFNLFYLAGFQPFGLKIDITPFGFIISSVVVAFGLIRYQLFNIVPIARDKIVEAMAEGIMVTDTSGRIVDVNPAMRKLLAPYVQQPIGLALTDLLPQLQLPENQFDPHGHHKLEINRTSDGINRGYSITITPMFDKQSFTGRIFVCKDVTEQREYAEKLESLNKLKDKLFSIISHDLRSPLISLLDLLSLNNEGMLSDEELRSFLPQLQKNVGYTSSLLENLLQWSKSQLQNAVTRPVVINLQALGTTMIETFKDRSAEKGIVMEILIAENTQVMADRDMVEAVFRNLLSNAIKFCNRDDTIRVSSEAGETHTTICIADTGVGISDPDIDKLFKADTFTKRGTMNEQGTGLGLLLAKDFIEKNQGRIWVHSELGKGSEFYFTLPNRVAVQ